MLAKLYTFSLLGIEAVPVEVEVDVSPGRFPRPFSSGYRKRRCGRARTAWNARSSIAGSSGPAIAW